MRKAVACSIFALSALACGLTVKGTGGAFGSDDGGGAHGTAAGGGAAGGGSGTGGGTEGGTSGGSDGATEAVAACAGTVCNGICHLVATPCCIQATDCPADSDVCVAGACTPCGAAGTDGLVCKANGKCSEDDHTCSGG
jgi:hypothetical protein